MVDLAEAPTEGGALATESFANPKSRILACPRSVTNIFAGLMSR